MQLRYQLVLNECVSIDEYCKINVELAVCMLN